MIYCPDARPVRIDSDLGRRPVISVLNPVSMTDYLSGIVRPRVEKDFQQAAKPLLKLDAQGAGSMRDPSPDPPSLARSEPETRAHTPGPWTIDPPTDRGNGRSEKSSYLIATVCGTTLAWNRGTPRSSRAAPDPYDVRAPLRESPIRTRRPVRWPARPRERPTARVPVVSLERQP